MARSPITVEWLSYKKIAFQNPEQMKNIGGMGGWFNNNFKNPQGHRWDDFVECYNKKQQRQLEAIRKSIIEKDIWQTGSWHQNADKGVPATSDGFMYMSSFRGWGDLMAAVWSSEYDKDYCYLDFYCSDPIERP